MFFPLPCLSFKTFNLILETVNSYGPQPQAEFPRGNVYLWCNFREGHANTDWCEFVIEGARNWKTRKIATGLCKILSYLNKLHKKFSLSNKFLVRQNDA